MRSNRLGYFLPDRWRQGRILLEFWRLLGYQRSVSNWGTIPVTGTDGLPGKMSQGMAVLAYSRDLGPVASSKQAGYIMLGYDDLYSIQYFNENLQAYWTEDGTVDIFSIVRQKDYATIMERCRCL